MKGNKKDMAHYFNIICSTIIMMILYVTLAVIVSSKVNKNFAIKLVAEEPVAEVGVRVVSCDGGGGALGHPKVYINLV